MDTRTAHRRLSIIGGHISQNQQQRHHVTADVASAVVAPSGKVLDGNVSIVTGSGQGIGKATALLFAKHGAKVVVTDLDKAKSDAVALEINESGGVAISVPGDVTHASFAPTVIDATIARFGKVNILVNNAGYTWDGVIHKMTDEQWDAMISVHNTAVFRLVREIAPHLREPAKKEMSSGGVVENRSIINVSSTSGLHGNFGQLNYSCAKMGVVGLTKTIAKEWGPFGIRCNTVAFGLVDTRLTRPKEEGESVDIGGGRRIALGIPGKMRGGHDFIPLRRPGTADEAAQSVLFLASPQSSYITGHTLEVTGGAGI
eukprot:TRINITY_DN1448_c0_g2_i1.p1 TRINITY_DN1448_c0_g2~~TRINITY_DN1448_c0_g2_i1.p1  ORF type:complete len:327 (+),score=52.02 TRINITY_DN1448_c0_g2_i1:38-982(+)